MVNQIREIVDYKYDGMIRLDAYLTTASFDDHRSQLELITTLLIEAHRMSELKPGKYFLYCKWDVINWNFENGIDLTKKYITGILIFHFPPNNRL